MADLKIMLDVGSARLQTVSEKYQFEFWQLRTPLTNRCLQGVPYGLDNGCFARFNKATWLRQVEQAHEIEPVFVTLPDIVGDARRTLELAERFLPVMEGLPAALVLQDGIGNHDIDWDSYDAVFVGGSDQFKCSQEAYSAARTAKILDKWVHVGRVNTSSRLSNWLGIADSIDGSGISRYDQMLDDIMQFLAKGTKQADLFDMGR